MIIDYKNLEKLKNEDITFVIGTFDLLHAGHLYFLNKAKEVAPQNKLLVGIISDKIVWERKGDNRPVVSQKQRAELVDALKLVDYVFIAPEVASGEVAKNVLDVVKPEYSVVTRSAWENRENPVETTGTEVVTIDEEVKDFSTTAIFEKIQSKFNYKQPYIVVAALLEKGGKFLLVKEVSGPARGLWNLPAGKLDKGESLQAAAVREVREESGFDFTVEKLIGVYIRHRNNNTILQAVFSGPFTEKTTSVDREISEVRWFTREEVMKMDTNTLRSEAIKQYIKAYDEGSSFFFGSAKRIYRIRRKYVSRRTKCLP